ncbi:hypothetical protein FOA52_002971 [Chlamydomonas sp. UWO 241]|nr:hypothetical protein FOA52_002971 [Chlamydomonas sp. UWO 241]
MLGRLSPPPTAFQLDILHFLAAPTPETLAQHGGGARGFLSMQHAALVVASNRDPTLYEYGAKPCSNKSIYVTIHSGAKSVTPEQYMDAVGALQPDLFVTMCDEVTADAPPKKAQLSVDRTVKWLDACLELRQTRGLAAGALAAIAGAGSVADRARCAEAAASREGVAGFALCGFGTGEAPGEAQRGALLAAAIGKLPWQRRSTSRGGRPPGKRKHVSTSCKGMVPKGSVLNFFTLGTPKAVPLPAQQLQQQQQQPAQEQQQRAPQLLAELLVLAEARAGRGGRSGRAIKRHTSLMVTWEELLAALQPDGGMPGKELRGKYEAWSFLEKISGVDTHHALNGSFGKQGWLRRERIPGNWHMGEIHATGQRFRGGGGHMRRLSDETLTIWLKKVKMLFHQKLLLEATPGDPNTIADKRPGKMSLVPNTVHASKPRFISGVCSPSEVLDAVGHGVDVFDNGYVAAATASGCALSFPLRPPQPPAEGHVDGDGAGAATSSTAAVSNGGEQQAGASESKLNLWSVAYRLDKGPLVPGCACFACARHSRAYVHHLLQVHEMLAEILLEMHNTHHYHAFMAEVRGAIECGTFESYRVWFRSQAGDVGGVRADTPPAQEPVRTVRAGWKGPGSDAHAAREQGAEEGGDGGSAPGAKKPRLQE